MLMQIVQLRRQKDRVHRAICRQGGHKEYVRRWSGAAATRTAAEMADSPHVVSGAPERTSDITYEECFPTPQTLVARCPARDRPACYHGRRCPADHPASRPCPALAATVACASWPLSACSASHLPSLISACPRLREVIDERPAASARHQQLTCARRGCDTRGAHRTCRRYPLLSPAFRRPADRF